MVDAGAVAVVAAFGVGGVLSLVGFVMAVGMLVVTPLRFTSLRAFAVYAATIVALGVAMVMEGVARR